MWSHVAITYVGGVAEFYVNGVLEHTEDPDDGKATDINDAPTSLWLGWDSCDSYLTGKLDDVAIYASALSTTEISKIYDDGLAGKAQCRVDPVTKADCKNGGWADFGFKNQGQCIRFVNTGKDSR